MFLDKTSKKRLHIASMTDLVKIKISFKSKHRIKSIDDKRIISITFYDYFLVYQHRFVLVMTSSKSQQTLQVF